ncbi:MAG TPA: hypothetical protein VLH13_00035, partial [Methanomassiliicoccales archaeon]|nr:hypothetical protein [Methanomassiliicoccales archaeon]
MTILSSDLLPKFKTEYGFAITRILLGWMFIWGFFDKTFGLGYATPASNAWISGGSPTAGYLQYGTQGPLSEFYRSIPEGLFTDTLFMMAML